MDANFQPLNDRVLVKRLPEPDKIGCIFMPGSMLPSTTLSGSTLARRTGGKELHDAGTGQRGVVIQVGPGRIMGGKNGHPFWRRPVELAIGQIVAFGQYFDAEDGEFVLIQEQDVKVILDNANIQYSERVSAPDEAA